MVRTRTGHEYSPFTMDTPPRIPTLPNPAQTPCHHTSTKTCICDGEMVDGPMIKCLTCKLHYHDTCVGLKGLRSLLPADEAGVITFEDWVCPECIITARLLRPGSPIFDALATKAAQIFATKTADLSLSISPANLSDSSLLNLTDHITTPNTAASSLNVSNPPTSSNPTNSTSPSMNTSNSAPPRKEQQPKSFADATRKSVPPQPRLTIQCDDVKTTRASLDKLLQEVPISSVKNLASSICVRFPNEKSRELAETMLKSSDILSDPTKVTTDVMSKVTLRFVPVDLLPEDSSRDDSHKFCLEKLRAKNDLLRDCPNLSIVYFKRTLKDPNFATVALKLPVGVKSQLLTEGRVFFHMSSVRVYHRVHVKRCPHCQGLGHYPDNCPNRGKPATCMFCSEHHNTDDCPVKNDASRHTCSNCVRSNKTDTSHHAGSVKCPSYKDHFDRLSKNSFQPSTQH